MNWQGRSLYNRVRLQNFQRSKRLSVFQHALLNNWSCSNEWESRTGHDVMWCNKCFSALTCRKASFGHKERWHFRTQCRYFIIKSVDVPLKHAVSPKSDVSNGLGTFVVGDIDVDPEASLNWESQIWSWLRLTRGTQLIESPFPTRTKPHPWLYVLICR